MSRVFARLDDMFIIKGVKLFPQQIEKVLTEEKKLSPNYQIILTREKGAIDEMLIKVEVVDEFFNDEVSTLNNLQKKLERTLHSELGVSCKIQFVEQHSLLAAASGNKIKKVLDKRDY